MWEWFDEGFSPRNGRFTPSYAENDGLNHVGWNEHLRQLFFYAAFAFCHIDRWGSGMKVLKIVASTGGWTTSPTRSVMKTGTLAQSTSIHWTFKSWKTVPGSSLKRVKHAPKHSPRVSESGISVSSWDQVPKCETVYSQVTWLCIITNQYKYQLVVYAYDLWMSDSDSEWKLARLAQRNHACQKSCV